jgi:hypothetical protein
MQHRLAATTVEYTVAGRFGNDRFEKPRSREICDPTESRLRALRPPRQSARLRREPVMAWAPPPDCATALPNVVDQRRFGSRDLAAEWVDETVAQRRTIVSSSVTLSG